MKAKRLLGAKSLHFFRSLKLKILTSMSQQGLKNRATIIPTTPSVIPISPEEETPES